MIHTRVSPVKSLQAISGVSWPLSLSTLRLLTAIRSSRGSHRAYRNRLRCLTSRRRASCSWAAAWMSFATIVYKHAAHTVSLTTLPPGRSVSDQAIAGYNVRSWSDAQFTYIAVSDLPSADLETFERAFSAGSPAPEVK